MNIQKIQFNQNINNSRKTAFGFKTKFANNLADKIIDKYGCRSLNPRIHNAIVKLNAHCHPEIRGEVDFWARLQNVYVRFGDEGWIKESLIPNSCKDFDQPEYLIIEKGRKPQIIPSDMYSSYIYGRWRPEPMNFKEKVKNFFFGQKEYKIVNLDNKKK